MLGGSAAMPACAEAQLPASMASNTPRQSLGMVTDGSAGGGAGTTCAGDAGLAGIGCGALPMGKGASGSWDCANTGAAQINAPNASTPAFTIDPPSEAA